MPAAAERSASMNLTTDRVQGIAIVRAREARLMYPLLSDFSNAVTSLIGAGERKIVIDLATVNYIDSATIGCLMDLYRQSAAAGGRLKLAGVNKRVETMLTMTGAHNFLEIHPDEAGAVASFGS
ncbi:MAG: anti-sigma factor antagonist [Acidobacteria bacterium]|nr:MAG: anti-sigma factor antagonist [Acidobacteriota bacterium]